MLVAVGKIVDSNGLIMGLRLYNTEKKVVKDIRLEEVPNQVKNLNQASRLGAVNANEDDLKPVVILSMDMVKAVIVNINGVEKTVTSVEELKKYKTIQIKSDIELYKEYMARAELAGGSQFEFSIDEDTEKVYIDKVNKVSKSEIENVVIPTFVTRVKGDSFREIKAKRLEVLSDNIIMNNTSYMFSRCEAEYIDLDYFNLRNITEMKKMFISCINLKKFELNNVNSKYITDISGMFKNCSKIKEIDISKLNMNIIRDMNSAFLGCEQLTKVKLSNPNKDEIRNMKSMFEDCEKLTDIQWSSYTLDIPNTDCSRLFYNCKSLRDTNLTSIYMNGYNEHKLYAKKNILLNKIDYPSYLDCTKYMFYCCKSLIKIPYLECKYCISIESMFENCESITNIDLDKFQFIVGGSTYHYFNEDVHNKAFKDCHKVTKIWISNLYLIEALDYNDNCDNHEFVEKTYKFEDTFKNCKNLKQISLAGYNPSRGIFNKERVDDISKNLENAKNKMIKNSKLKNDIVVKIDRSTERNCYRF